MIPFLRQASSSILMRILLAVIVIALALSLGISTFFTNNASKRPVAKVGSSMITAVDFAQELENKKHALKQHFGRALTDQEALGVGLVNKTLSELITRELITQEAMRIGIMASDEQLSKQLTENPQFKDANGKFNPKMFADYLGKTHSSERKYLEDLRHQISRGMLANVMDTQLHRTPKAFSEPMFRYLNEELDIEVISIEIDKLPNFSKPDTAILKQFYDQHTQQFYAPESRSFNTLLLNFHEISQTIQVSNEDLMSMYHQRDNKVPEKRSVRLIPFAVREDSIKARTELIAGAPFESVYSRYTGDAPENAPQPQELELKKMRPEIGSEIFSMKKIHDVSEPIFLGGQYVLFVLTEIKPERTLSFEEQKFAILKEYKMNLTRDKMYEYTQRAEKMLSSGSKLTEIASIFHREGIPGIKVITVDKVTQSGKSIEGSPIADLSTLDSKVLSLVFDTPQYTYSDPQKLESEDYVIVEVTDIQPAHQRSFEASIQQVETHWQFEQKRQLAMKYIKNIQEGLKKFEDPHKLAATYSGKVDVLRKVKRSNPPKDPLFSSIFTKANDPKAEKIVIDVTTERIQLGRIIGSYPVTMDTFDENASAFARHVMRPLLSRDLLSSYVSALEHYFPVTRNDDYFINFFGKESLNNAQLSQAPDF